MIWDDGNRFADPVGTGDEGIFTVMHDRYLTLDIITR